MMTKTRSRTLRCFVALFGAAALLAALPAPALAGGRHHDGRGHHGRGHDRDCDHGRGHAHGRQQVVYAPRYQPAPRRVYAGYYRPPAPSYYCGRCRAHFASQGGLYGHVHVTHRVPTWQLPGVVAQVSFGWAFGF
jgi:hypothetical protein